MSLTAIDTLMGLEKIAAARATLARISVALNALNAPGRGLPPLILMTDDQRDADYLEAVRALPPGSAVIVRHRNPVARERLARSLLAAARAHGSRCLLAGDPDLAKILDADGVHASEAQLRQIAAWRKQGPNWLITAAVHSASAVAKAQDADALLLAPVFPTASHPQAQALGVAAFDAIASQIRVPVYALGGITAENAPQLGASRAAGIALIGGWLRS
jgi:thiamine-phosphate pyrophosphorylase